MTKTLKRGLSMLFVVALMASMLSIPAQAGYFYGFSDFIESDAEPNVGYVELYFNGTGVSDISATWNCSYINVSFAAFSPENGYARLRIEPWYPDSFINIEAQLHYKSYCYGYRNSIRFWCKGPLANNSDNGII